METEVCRIERVLPVNSKDARGPTRQLISEKGFQVTVCERVAGAVSGPHVHKGKDPSKNPETLYMVYGDAALTYQKPDGRLCETRIQGGDLITIPPNVPHKIRFIRPSCILEIRSTIFDPKEPDTVAVEL